MSLPRFIKYRVVFTYYYRNNSDWRLKMLHDFLCDVFYYSRFALRMTNNAVTQHWPVYARATALRKRIITYRVSKNKLARPLSNSN